jgi:hypothetical protein
MVWRATRAVRRREPFHRACNARRARSDHARGGRDRRRDGPRAALGGRREPAPAHAARAPGQAAARQTRVQNACRERESRAQAVDERWLARSIGSHDRDRYPAPRPQSCDSAGGCGQSLAGWGRGAVRVPAGLCKCAQLPERTSATSAPGSSPNVCATALSGAAPAPAEPPRRVSSERWRWGISTFSNMSCRSRIQQPHVSRLGQG